MDCSNRLNIVLIEPEIPGNTGSIGRLCVGLDARLILVEPLGYSLEDKYLKRAGLDYWPHLDWETMPSVAAFFERFPPSPRMFFFTTKTRRPYTQPHYQPGDFLIFGKETKGLSPELLAQYAEQTLTIPMFGPIRSLNLATSVGIAAYEAMRQITGGFP